MVKDLRDELKAQIEENKELEKKIDGLITVIHLARNHIKHPIFNSDEKKPADILFDVLEILESVDE